MYWIYNYGNKDYLVPKKQVLGMNGVTRHNHFGGLPFEPTIMKIYNLDEK